MMSEFLKALDTETLLGPKTLDLMVASIRTAAFALDQDDAATLVMAADFQVDDPADYARGFQLLEELKSLESRVKKHHDQFRGPLNTLIAVVREIEGEVAKPVAVTRTNLGNRLASWKIAADAKDAERRRQAQIQADAVVRTEQQAKAAALRLLADQQQDAQMRAVMAMEAAAVATTTVLAAPVKIESSVPVVSGHTRTFWKATFTDVKKLMAAWLAGTCHLPDDQIEAGLQSFMDRQATAHHDELGKVYPGTEGVSVTTPVVRARK
jgi:hypothetical protein